MKYVVLLLMVFFVQGCAEESAEKYELKSPCVSADTDKDAPCQRRRPVNQGIS
jgi:hypothetical protein